MTKYPVVLVHGTAAKNFRFYKAFRHISGDIREAGVTVYVLGHDGIGSIENNAAQIKREIETILEKEHAEKVNLIAHSKGGLDSRYMISKLDMGTKVASLTTLSTPHYGSKMCTKLLKMPKWLAKIIVFWGNLFYKIFGDEHPDLLTLADELTDYSLQRFNEEVKNDENVYYQSFSSDIGNRKNFIMYLPHKFSVYCEKTPTDGIISVESSKWGDFRGNIDDFDHLEMVGFRGSRKKLKRVSQFYLTVIKRLSELGF